MGFEASIEVTCGQLVVGGFPGMTLPASYAKALAQGRRGGAVLFKPNVSADLAQVAALNASIRDAALHAPALPKTRAPSAPLVAVDQEGGRVERLKAPVLELPPMRELAAMTDAAFAERAACAQARELASLGFTMSFAPVLDVDTCADNPVIGDRAFASDADTVARFGEAWLRGLARGGLLSCGKHFPGHGDTSKDSHVDLPVVDQPRARLDAVELTPFRMAARAGAPSLMTAHVVYPALDAERPATLSPFVCTHLLREEIGFRGVLFSDDLEMRAILDRWGIEDAAVQAIAAGCDQLLVCWEEELQERAHAALVREANASAAFRARCAEAAARAVAMRESLRPAAGGAPFAAVVGGGESRAAAEEIARRRRA
jgi:beta-N-acetylhexosaminidase